MQAERQRIIDICDNMHFPPDEYIVVSSGSMIMHGITQEERGKPMGDLDIFCTTSLWFHLTNQVSFSETDDERLLLRKEQWNIVVPNPRDKTRRADPPILRRMLYGLNVDVFFNWRTRPKGNLDVNFLLNQAIFINDIPCVPMQHVYDWKCEVGRAKDQRDIEILRTRHDVKEWKLDEIA